MTFYFFDQRGQRLYRRDDAVEAEHFCDDFACRMLFPADERHPLNAGMLVAWLDDDDAWECHEITSVSSDAFGDTVEIDGVHMAVADLRAMVIESAKYTEESIDYVLDRVLSGTAWRRGVLTVAASTDPRARYRITTSGSRLNLRSGPGSSYSSIGQYRTGTYVVLIEITSAQWYKVEAPDGRVGWMSSDYLTQDGTASGDMSGYTVSIDEKWITVWAALESAAKSAEVLLAPRVEITDGNITGKYIDVRTTEPEFRGVRLTCDANVQDASVTYDVSGLYTALYGLGADDVTFGDVTWTVAGGDPANKPKGQKYVEDPAAKAIWGRAGINRTGIVRFADVKNRTELLRRTWDELQRVNEPRIEIDAKVIDLYRMGYAGQSMRLYDMVYVIMQPIGLMLEARIISLTRDLLHPDNTRPRIGTDLQRDLMRDVVAARNDSAAALQGLMRAQEAEKDALQGTVQQSPADDLDAVISSGEHFGFFITNAESTGTPYKAGLTGWAAGAVLSYASSDNNAVQVSFGSGTDKIFVRKRSSGVTDEWSVFASSDGNALYVMLASTDIANRYIADHTVQQIGAAYEAGRPVYCVADGIIYPLFSATKSGSLYSFVFSLYWGGRYESFEMYSGDIAMRTANYGGVLHQSSTPVIVPSLSDNTSKLMYVDANGALAPIALDPILKVEDGKLKVGPLYMQYGMPKIVPLTEIRLIDGSDDVTHYALRIIDGSLQVVKV